MDRASGCGPEGRRFDSCQGHKLCVFGVNRTGKGSGKTRFSRGGSIETAGFQRAQRVRFSCQGHKGIARRKAGFCVLGVSERFHSRQESNAGAIFVSRQKCEAVARQIFATAKI